MRVYDTYIFNATYDSKFGEAVETFSRSNIIDAILSVARAHCGLPYTVRNILDFRKFTSNPDATIEDVVKYMEINNENLISLSNETNGVTYFG